MNLNNLVLYNFGFTGHILATLFLALFFFSSFIIIAFLNFQLNFLKFFVPKNVPFLLQLLLIFIEMASFFIRPFSLSIRLFANILAGHTLLHIFGSFYFYILNKYLFLLVVPLILCFLILLLEVGVAFIQAYVFFILLSVYLNDIYNLH